MTPSKFQYGSRDGSDKPPKDWDGMLPAENCHGCGKPLNADGGHPAELYAGTFTGLCYECEKKGPYAVKVFRSGAVQWSFPPHCPAWRRDRELFIGYQGCEKCGGKGRIMISRSMSQGGPYPKQCEDCSDRHYSHYGVDELVD